MIMMLMIIMIVMIRMILMLMCAPTAEHFWFHSLLDILSGEGGSITFGPSDNKSNCKRLCNSSNWKRLLYIAQSGHFQYHRQCRRRWKLKVWHFWFLELGHLLRQQHHHTPQRQRDRHSDDNNDDFIDSFKDAAADDDEDKLHHMKSNSHTWEGFVRRRPHVD